MGPQQGRQFSQADRIGPISPSPGLSFQEWLSCRVPSAKPTAPRTDDPVEGPYKSYNFD